MREMRMAVAAAAVAVTTVAMPAVAQQGSDSTVAPQTPGATMQQGNLSDAMVHKVGTALRNIATIRQTYSTRAQSENSPQQKQDLTAHAQQDVLKAISDQGLTVQQYNQVIQMARTDPTLKQRLISAAQSGG